MVMEPLEQPVPLQPAKVEPASGTAVRVTMVPLLYDAATWTPVSPPSASRMTSLLLEVGAATERAISALSTPPQVLGASIPMKTAYGTAAQWTLALMLSVNPETCRRHANSVASVEVPQEPLHRNTKPSSEDEKLSSAVYRISISRRLTHLMVVRQANAIHLEQGIHSRW